jgi:hypothetical protein
MEALQLADVMEGKDAVEFVLDFDGFPFVLQLIHAFDVAENVPHQILLNLGIDSASMISLRTVDISLSRVAVTSEVVKAAPPRAPAVRPCIVLQRMLRRCPEIHGHGTDLYLHLQFLGTADG